MRKDQNKFKNKKSNLKEIYSNNKEMNKLS